jgi:hypothetical protein
LLPGIDGRSVVARRYQDIIASLTSDAGGNGNISEARHQLIRRFAASAVLAEEMESRLANGEQTDIAAHALLCSTLTRIVSRIGINRHSKAVTPLRDYLEAKALPATTQRAAP